MDTPRAAAQRILDNTNESGLTKPEVAEQASQWTLANLDAQVTLPLLDEVVLGGVTVTKKFRPLVQVVIAIHRYERPIERA